MVETSVFGAEFMAVKQLIDAQRGLWYRLKMMVISISGPSHEDNMSVIQNMSRPKSVIKKKNNQYVITQSVN